MINPLMIETLKKPFRQIWILKHPFPRQTLFWSFLLVIAALVLIIVTIGSLSFPVVLRFNERQGILMFGEQAQVLGVWLSFLALWAINAFLAEFLYFRERMLAYTLVVLNAFLSLFLLAAIVTIVLVN